MLLTQLIRRQYLYFCTRKASKLSKLSTPLRAAPQASVFVLKKASKLSKLSTSASSSSRTPCTTSGSTPSSALPRCAFYIYIYIYIYIYLHYIFKYIYIFIYIYIACERLHHTSEVVIFKARRHKFVLITGFFFPPLRWQEIEQLFQAVAQICTMGGAPGKTGEVSDAT